MDTQQCLDEPIRLTLDIDDGDNRPSGTGTIGGNGFTHVVGERPSLLEPEFAMPGSRKAIPRIRHKRQQPHLLAAPGCVGDEHAPETGVNGSCFVGQRLETRSVRG